MNKPLRINQQKQPRTALYDNRNKLTLPPPALKPNSVKTRITRANTYTAASSGKITLKPELPSLPASPSAVSSQPVEFTMNPFSKSDEETRAQQEERTQSSPRKESVVSWTGVLGEYKEQIMSYVLKREDEYRIDGGYLHHSHILSSKMRIYLVRHMYKIYHRFDLLRNTLHLAVHYMDLYFSKQLVLSDQIEGIHAAQACLLIAMKYQEIYPPELKDWVDRKHRQDVLKMEAKILSALNYQLAHYTVQSFLKIEMWERGETEIDDEHEDEFHIGLLIDLSLFDLNVRQLPGSQVAATIRALAMHEEPADYKIGLAVKWMVERNSQSLFWLGQQKYGRNVNFSLF